jgi:aldose 1-epimerase
VEPPSGAQWELRRGRQRAIVVEVGAALREYELDGEPILDGFGLAQMPDGARGQPLLPWPNRLRDGHYAFGGQELQLPIDEVARNNASHGLTRWLNWRLVSQTSSRVELTHTVHPRPGYPFTLQLTIAYALGDVGLTVQTRAENRGTQALPFGAGQHPYFSVGTERVDTAILRVPAGSRLEVDEQRRLPTGRVLPVAGTEQDFRSPREIGSAELDECYVDLQRDADGRVRATLTSPDLRRGLTFWMGQRYRYMQVFTGDTLAPARRRQGVAIEPMTCPPNAFQSGVDLIVVEPGESVELEWGVEV